MDCSMTWAQAAFLLEAEPELVRIAARKTPDELRVYPCSDERVQTSVVKFLMDNRGLLVSEPRQKSKPPLKRRPNRHRRSGNRF